MTPTFPMIPWLQDWRRVGLMPLEQRNYVKAELKRIADAGAPVITHVLRSAMEQQAALALSILASDTPLGRHRFWLRLVPGTRFDEHSPFLRDAEGHSLPDGKRGHVLMAKVGTLGGQIQNVAAQPDSVLAEFSGSNLQRNHNLSEPNYKYVEIGTEPVDVSATEAVLILRKYGVGIPQKRFTRTKPSGRPSAGDFTADGKPLPPVDWWIVEEVPPSFINNDGSVRERMTSSSPSKGKAA